MSMKYFCPEEAQLVPYIRALYAELSPNSETERSVRASICFSLGEQRLDNSTAQAPLEYAVLCRRVSLKGGNHWPYFNHLCTRHYVARDSYTLKGLNSFYSHAIQI